MIPRFFRVGSALDLQFSVRRPAPGQAVVATGSFSCDDVMAHYAASHAARVEHLQYGGGAGSFGLRIAPGLGAPHPARLGRIQPLYALEQELAVLGPAPNVPRNG